MFGIDEFIPHPLKRYSRISLCFGIWVASACHLAIVGVFYVLSMSDSVDESVVHFKPYPLATIEILNPKSLNSDEESGSASKQARAPEEPDLLNRNERLPVPVPLAVGIPQPVEDSPIAEEQDITSPQQAPNDLAQNMKAGNELAGHLSDGVGNGNGTNDGGEAGGGAGSLNGGSDGIQGTVRYDTPPIPRRVNLSISLKDIPRKLRHVRESIIRFEILVNKLGEVVDASITKSTGYVDIDHLLLKKVYAFKYHPATLSGQPIQAKIAVGYGYTIRS